MTWSQFRARFEPAAPFVIVILASIALLLHARIFDFFCDDAFITLRYSRNFATLGEPIYNVGERVEGYTSFSWMALVTVAIRFGANAVTSAQVLGAISSVLLLVATWRTWGQLEPRLRWAAALILFALAGSAPLAAWTMGGLETPLFAALVVASIGLGANAAGFGGARRGAIAGSVVALATLTRPEGAALFAAILLVTSLIARKRKEARPAAIAIALSFAAIMGPFVAWRWHYYGAPLPNTFYVKTSGHVAERFTMGRSYLRLAASEIGIPVVFVLLASLCIPARRSKDEGAGAPSAVDTTRNAALWMMRLFILVIVPYVASVGGDFLDLYRFFVPILPLLFLSATLGAYRILVERIPLKNQGWTAAFAATMLLSPYLTRERVIGIRARHVSEPLREKASVEPVGWTRQQALRWAATGRWIAEHSKPDDWMATGAAGAMPFYAKINNLDILGLNDAYVAHYGTHQGEKPGHQREAPEWYTLSKTPVFLFIEDAFSDEEQGPKRDAKWEAKGYFRVEVHLDEHYGAEKPFFHRFLMRLDRASELMGTPNFRSAIGQPS